MSPVHVIVGDDQRAEAMWATAFAGAVDLYRFDRNVDAFERLTSAEAPVDLIVLTPAQRGPFNLTADQFVARVLEGPLGQSRYLANLHVIVVGQGLTRSHPRAMAVSTLDAAIRLVKFGEVERAPKPQAMAVPAVIEPTIPTSGSSIDSILDGDTFSSSVISSIWRAGDETAAGEAAAAAPAPKPVEPSAPSVAPRVEPETKPDVMGGGPPAQPELFSRATAPGFVIAPAVRGGGAAAPAADPAIGAPGESIEVASGVLQSSRHYALPHGAGYRGPAHRGGQVNAASHEVARVAQPVPPALASQVQNIVYGGAASSPADPLLVWSSSSRGQIVAQGVPVPGAAGMASVPVQPAAPAVMPVVGGGAAAPAPTMPAAMPTVVRTVPLEPPSGVYGSSPAAAGAPMAAPAPTTPAPAADPFLARAEQGGGDVSFG